jgi:hypothetical protein
MSRSLVFVFLGLFAAAGVAASPAPDANVPSILWNQPAPHSADATGCVPAASPVANRGIAVGPDQNPVFLGDVARFASTLVLAKYDRQTGERLWCTSFQVRATIGGVPFNVAFAQAGGVAVDSNGTIFIAGHGVSTPFSVPFPGVPGLPAPTPVLRYFVITCSASGVCAPFATLINPGITATHTDNIGGIAIGPDGNPVLTGVATFPASTPSKPSTFKLLTVKVSRATLAPLGVAQGDTNAPVTGSRVAVAVDSLNNIVVTGTEASTSKYDALLSRQLWNARIAGSGVAITSSGRGGDRDDHGSSDRGGDRSNNADAVAVAGAPVNDASGRRHFTIAVLDGARGNTVWTAPYNSGFDDNPRDIAADQNGNIVVAADTSGSTGSPAVVFQRGVLVSVNGRGQLNWMVVIPSSLDDRSLHSITRIALGADGAPVVSEDSRNDPSATVAHQIIQLDFDHDRHGRDGRDDDEDDNDGRKDRGALAWDQPVTDTVTGFLVCVDSQPVSACQDVGKPEAIVLPSTTVGTFTYQFDLAKITALTKGQHTLAVVAYNGEITGGESAGLTVETDNGRRHHGRD